MTSMTVIIDLNSDSDFYTEVRALMGVESEDLPDDTLRLDIMTGMAEREVCQIYVPNWKDVLNGADPFAVKALRSSVICKLCLNILQVPAIQNLFINELRIVDIILKADINIEKLKKDLTELFQSQLSIVGVVRTDAWPEFQAIGKTDNILLYDYKIDRSGIIQQTLKAP